MLSSCFAPTLFRAVEHGFKAFGRAVGVVLTWALLVPFFGMVFAPGRLLLILRRKDPMDRLFPNEGVSGWQPHHLCTDKNRYTKQYK